MRLQTGNCVHWHFQYVTYTNTSRIFYAMSRHVVPSQKLKFGHVQVQKDTKSVEIPITFLPTCTCVCMGGGGCAAATVEVEKVASTACSFEAKSR